MENKKNQIAKTGQQAGLAVINTSQLVDSIQSRQYHPADIKIMERMQLALANDILPLELALPFKLLAMRKGGRRIGPQYGCVTVTELVQHVQPLLPQFCAFLGVPWDQGYLAMAQGVAINLRRHYSFLALEEIDFMHTAVWQIPLDAMPEPYQVLDVRAVLEVVREYVRHVFSAGRAHRWLEENVELPEEMAVQADDQPTTQKDPRIKEDDSLDQLAREIQQKILQDVFEEFCRLYPADCGTYNAARIGCNNIGQDMYSLAAYVRHRYVAMLSSAELEQATDDAMRVLRKRLACGYDVTFSGDILEKEVDIFIMAYLFKKWKKGGMKKVL